LAASEIPQVANNLSASGGEDKLLGKEKGGTEVPPFQNSKNTGSD